MDIKITETVNVNYTADVAVIGGGVAGVAAAVAAARKGAKTVLIEQSGCLGGLATNGHVSPFDATHDRKGKPFGGIAQEILDGMDEAQEKYGCPNTDSKRVGPHLFKWVLLNLAVQSGVNILFYADLIKTVCEDDKIKYAVLHTKSGLEAVSAEMFIDATGDGELIAGAGEEFILGSEKDTGEELKKSNLNRMHFEDKPIDRYENTENQILSVQPSSVMFTLGNVDLSKRPFSYNNKNLTFADLGIDKEEFKKLPFYGTVGFEDNGDLVPIPQGRVLLSHTSRPNEVLVNMSRVIGVDATNEQSMSEGTVIAYNQVMYITEFLKRCIPGFENCYLVDSSNVLGVRESRRLVGEYVLSGIDAITCRQFEDTVACGSYMIDIHDPFGKRRAIGGDINGSCYGIPYRSLIPKRVKNMLVCGRCISVDHVAHASTRIQGTCVMTGQAAGTAAALAAQNGVCVQKLDTKALVSDLLSQGLYLGK